LRYSTKEVPGIMTIDKETLAYRNSRGITALELMVVLSIVGLTFLFSLPGMASYRDSIELNEAVTQVAGHMALARQKAVTQHNDFIFVFTSDSEYTILDDENSNGAQDPGEKTLGPYKLPGTVHVTYLTPGPSFAFSPSGMLRQPGQQVAVDFKNANGTTKGVTVWASGSIEIRT
jgi:Tfp pilus assembly protein FimT